MDVLSYKFEELVKEMQITTLTVIEGILKVIMTKHYYVLGLKHGTF